MDTASEVDEEMLAQMRQRDEQVQAAMDEAGVGTVPQQVDYFGCDEQYEVTLPDGASKVYCQKLNEGERKKYQNKVTKDVTLKKGTGDASMKLASGDDRHALLEAAIVGWNLVRNGEPIAFSKGSAGSTLALFLQKAPPEVVDVIEREIRKHETWIIGETSLDDLLRQRDELDELIEQKRKYEAGNGD